MSLWFRCVQSRPAASLRLICFPHAGGSASFYRSWSERISPKIEVTAVQYPGRADRLDEAVVEDAATQIRLVMAALPPLCDRPIALFGHSMGAFIAYEVARNLEAAGTAPVHLFVSGCRAAHLPPKNANGRRVSELDDDGLIKELMWMGGTDVELFADPELRAMVLTYVRGDFRLTESYRYAPDPALSVPITSINGVGDQAVPVEWGARWAELTSGGFVQRTLPGDHFFLVPHRDEVIAEIESRLL